MPDRPPAHSKFESIGGDPCLDFANTLGGLRGGATVEHLTGYADLVAWARHSGLLDERAARALACTAAREPREARRALGRALALREAIYQVFAAVASSLPVPRPALDLINGGLPRAVAPLQIREGPGGYSWGLPEGDPDFDVPLWGVLKATLELLTSGRVRQVRECSGDACSWLFLDRTKNQSRLWCDMRGCGNRAKMRRHRARQSNPVG